MYHWHKELAPWEGTLIDWQRYAETVRHELASCAPGTSVATATERVSQRLGMPITYDALKDACRRHLGESPRHVIGQGYTYATKPHADIPSAESAGTIPVPRLRDVGEDDGVCVGDGSAMPRGLREVNDTDPAPTSDSADLYGSLVKIVKRGANFEDLCNRMRLCPSDTRKLIAAAQDAGYLIDVAGNVVAQVAPEPSESIVDIGVAPVVGGRQLVGVIGDIHAGSKYFLRDPMRDFIKHAYDTGVRHLFVPGDLLDGCYRHGRFELSHHGVDDQTEDLLDTLPEYPGLDYHYITGNHDETFTESTGLDTGRLIEDRAFRRGRTDMHYHGCRGGLLKLGTVKIELWHPKKGISYALSYGLQKKIEKIPPATGRKPDILIAGHWHSSCYIEQRAVHAIASPCWQGGGSSFGKSLGGAPSIGGLVLSWELTAHGTLRRFNVERSSYYEIETYREVAA